MNDFNLYTLKQNDKDQLHLFRSKKGLNNSCTAEIQSICKKMKHKAESVYSCKPEEFIRTKCAEIGRPVCGICVSNLYGDH